MSNTEFERLVRELVSDTELAEEFRIYPERVVENYELTECERDAIISGVPEEVRSLSERPDEGSEAWLVGKDPGDGSEAWMVGDPRD